MIRKRILSPPTHPVPTGLVVLAMAAGCGGCSTVNVAEQRLVSKANMTFSDSSVFDYSMDFHSRLEPGTAGSGGGQASGCTSCK
ncbi:MAG: hypothetical protein DRP71_07355 [Verrucomicrobia bacterium]|nr:MAG: hypothetical protein DRP71_07355 [Verrucomicrobiota bacterium]